MLAVAEPLLRWRAKSEIGKAKRNPLARAWQAFPGYCLLKTEFAELEREHQLFWRCVGRTESFAHHLGRQCESAVSPAETAR